MVSSSGLTSLQLQSPDNVDGSACWLEEETEVTGLGGLRRAGTEVEETVGERGGDVGTGGGGWGLGLRPDVWRLLAPPLEAGATVDNCSCISIIWSPSLMVRFRGAFPDKKSLT